MSRLVYALVALLVAVPLGAVAQSIERVTLADIAHTDAMLSIESGGQSVDYTPEALEEFDTYRLVTTTPWRPEAATFEGVLLRDVLARHDMMGTDGIRVIAENGFEVTIPASVIESATILIATRVDGKPHSRRNRGPIQFVMPMSEYEGMPNMRESYWVWMAARVKPIG